ncbi:MAG: LuxR C-terminal-related transcriptional regulator [Candidatus Sericytochromatia bacterium]
MEININKLNIPTIQSNIIDRKRLNSLLNNTVNKKVIYISSGIGTGKTTFLVNWFTTNKHFVAWINLNKFDNENKIFFKALISSIRNNIYYNFLKNFNIKYEISDYISLLNEIINNFIYLDKIDFKIALDNFESIDNPNLLEYIEYLIKYAPSNVHFYILSRRTNTSFISNNYNQSILITEKNMNFSFEELQKYYNNKISDINTNDINEIYDFTQGWILALDICYPFLNKTNSIVNYYNNLNNYDYNSNILYLLTEINKLPNNIYLFLIKISIFDFFNNKLCDHLYDINNSQLYLSYLEEFNFIKKSSLDSDFYILNKFLSRTLFDLFQKNYYQDEIKIRQKSINWYIDNEYYVYAIDQSINLNELNRIVDLIKILDNKNKLNEELYKYIKYLSIKDILGSENISNIYLKYFLLDYDIESAENFIDKIIEIGKWKYFEIYKAHIKIIKSNYSCNSDIFNDFLNNNIEDEEYIMKGFFTILNFFYNRHDIINIQKFIDKKYKQIRNPENKLKIKYGYTMMLQMNLKVKKALKYSSEVISDILKNNLEDKFHYILIPILGDDIFNNLLIGDKDKNYYVEKIISLKELSENKGVFRIHYIHNACRYYIMNNDLSVAEELIYEIENLYHEVSNKHIILQSINHLKILFLLFKEDDNSLREYTKNIIQDIINIKYNDLSIISLIFLCTIYLDDIYSYKKIQEILKSRNISEKPMLYLLYIVRKSIFEYKTNNNDYIKTLTESIKLSSKESIKGPFIYLPKPLLRLMQMMINNLYNHLDKFKDFEITFIKDINLKLSNIIPENNLYASLLTNKEREILIMLSKGVSNKEVAKELFISPNTLKVHLSRVYKKINVNNKREALLFAIRERII